MKSQRLRLAEPEDAPSRTRLRTVPALAAAGVLASPALAVAQEAEGGGAIFSLDLGLVIWTWVLFLLTLGILAWKVFPYISGSLEERQRKIQDAIDEARSSREEAERLREEQRAQLRASRRQAQELLAEAREAGEKLRQEILAEAREEQERLLERARAEMVREREELREEIRKETVEISLAVAERLIRARLDTEEHRRLVRDYVRELG